mmetsp:Transcript_16964/g.23307  ORF Transcript_16964/g.23307 Transcript_16964/m.23307 type:complete len:236 (-) Transcript_16964:379-1086(-)
MAHAQCEQQLVVDGHELRHCGEAVGEAAAAAIRLLASPLQQLPEAQRDGVDAVQHRVHHQRQAALQCLHPGHQRAGAARLARVEQQQAQRRQRAFLQPLALALGLLAAEEHEAAQAGGGVVQARGRAVQQHLRGEGPLVDGPLLGRVRHLPGRGGGPAEEAAGRRQSHGEGRRGPQARPDGQLLRPHRDVYRVPVRLQALGQQPQQQIGHCEHALRHIRVATVAVVLAQPFFYFF